MELSDKLNATSFLLCFCFIIILSSLPRNETLNAGNKMNYHSHNCLDEFWVVISGSGTTIVGGSKKEIMVGDVITMKAGMKHTVINKTELQIIEVQLGKEMSVSDKTEYE